MNFESFFESTQKRELKIRLGDSPTPEPNHLNNEALFQLPMISLIILVLAKDRSKPYVSEIGQILGEAIEDSIKGFKGSSQHLGWSANLRVRTVKAINFLEQNNLILINNRKGRIKITDLGKKVVSRAMKEESSLSYSLALIERSYRNIRISRQLDMELL